jgi:hypothetical protein
MDGIDLTRRRGGVTGGRMGLAEGDARVNGEEDWGCGLEEQDWVGGEVGTVVSSSSGSDQRWEGPLSANWRPL